MRSKINNAGVGVTPVLSIADIPLSHLYVCFVPISEVNAIIRSPRQRASCSEGGMVSRFPDMRVI